MSGILYKLDFASGKSYIGVTTGPLSRRFHAHKRAAILGVGFLAHGAWRKYGQPTIIKLAIVERHQIMDTERRAILAYGTVVPGGYNMTPGGSPMHVPEIAARMSALMKGRVFSKEHKEKIRAGMLALGANHAMKNKLHAARHGDALRGRPLSENTRAKISAAKLGVKNPAISGENNPTKRPEVAAKIAAAKRGDLNPMKRPEVAAKVSASMRGRKLTQAHRESIARGQTGSRHSDETRKKMSDSQRRRHELRRASSV